MLLLCCLSVSGHTFCIFHVQGYHLSPRCTQRCFNSRSALSFCVECRGITLFILSLAIAKGKIIAIMGQPEVKQVSEAL